MKRKRKNKYNIKFFKSPFLMGGIIFILIIGYGCFIFIATFPPARIILRTPFLCVGTCFATVICPTFVLCGTIKRFFVKIIIDENGIETSLFKVFCKKKWAWEEIKEIFCGWRVVPWLFLSKKPDAFIDRTYEKLIKDKDLLQIEMTSKKVYRAIKHYWDKPIIGITEEVEKQLKLL